MTITIRDFGKKAWVVLSNGTPTEFRFSEKEAIAFANKLKKKTLLRY